MGATLLAIGGDGRRGLRDEPTLNARTIFPADPPVKPNRPKMPEIMQISQHPAATPGVDREFTPRRPGASSARETVEAERSFRRGGEPSRRPFDRR